MLPDLLGLRRRGLSVEEHPLPWPPIIRAVRDASSSKELRRLIGQTLANDSEAPPEGIFDDVAPGRPVMLTLPLQTEDLARGGVEALRAFFDFWNEWPDLPPGRTLICVVSVRHQRAERVAGLFRRRGLRSADREVRAFIEGLNFGDRTNLSGVVLSELRPVIQQDVAVWSRSEHVRAKCRIRESAIDEIFKHAPDGSIPMESLANKLKKLMEQNRL